MLLYIWWNEKKTELLQLIKSEKCWRTAAFSWRDTFAWRQFARFYARLQQRHVSFCHSSHSHNWQKKHYIYLALDLSVSIPSVAKCRDDLDTLIVWDDSLLTVSVFGAGDNYSVLGPASWLMIHWPQQESLHHCPPAHSASITTGIGVTLWRPFISLSLILI